MERQTQCTRRSLRQVRTRLPATLQITWVRTRLPATLQITWVLLAICGSLAAVEGHKCDSDIITLDHTRALKELIDNQALDACHVPFSFMTLPDRDADNRHKVCYLLAATSSVKAILESQKKNYKNTSSNYNNAEKLDLLLKTLREEKCIQRQHAENCYRTFSGSPADMLTMVEHFFNLTKEVLPIDASSNNCAALYATCEEPAKDNPPQNEAYTTPGPDQCKCSCPTPGSTSSALTSIKAIAASPEAIGIKKPTPTRFMISASRQGGARVARTLQYLPATPDSLQAPETPRTPTVSTSQSTVATEALFITDALEPTLRGTRRPPGLALESQNPFTPGSVTEKRLFGSTDEPVSETTGTADYQPSTEDIIIGSTEGPVSVTKEISPHRMPTEEDIIGSTKGHVFVTAEIAARQSPTEEKTTGSSEGPFSLGVEITTYQPSSKNNLIGSSEGHLSLTTDTATYQMSTKDNFIGSTEGPMPMSTQTAIHHMPKENTRSTEDPLSLTTETATHSLSTDVNVIGTTDAPMFVTEHLIQQTSSEKENSLRTMNTVSVTARATPLRTSSHDEISGHSEVPKSVIDWHKSSALDTPKTERPTTFPSTSLIPEDSTRATPEADTGRGTSQVHPAPGVFQYRGEGTLQSDGRGVGSDGTSHDSNVLPLYGSGSGRNQNGDEEESDRRVHIYVMVPCVLGILVSLCALLYYRRQNQSLRRELQQAVSRSERQEEGPLQRLQRDEVEVEMDEV